jgi:deoxyadenosine/deoxycytidine kinase
MERSPLTDKYVFMELQRSIIGEMFTKMYDIWWDTWIQLIPQELQKCPWKIIYLKPSLEKCMSRLINRAREGEEKITMEYQRRLRQAHKNYMKISKHQTIVISGDLVNNDFRTDENCKKLMDDVILKMNIHNKFN